MYLCTHVCRSAVVEAHGVDRLSANDFMKLLGTGTAAKGPTDGQYYNAMLVLADPKDKLASIVFRVASGTQVSLTRWYTPQGTGPQCTSLSVPSTQLHQQCMLLAVQRLQALCTLRSDLIFTLLSYKRQSVALAQQPCCYACYG